MEEKWTQEDDKTGGEAKKVHQSTANMRLLGSPDRLWRMMSLKETEGSWSLAQGGKHQGH